MKKLLTAIDLDMDGKGVCKDDKKTYFIQNLLIGESVLIETEQCNKDICFLKANINDILNISKERKIGYDFLDYANLIHLNDNEQLKFQYNLTKSTLEKFKIDYEKIYETITDNNFYEYRNKITLFVDNSNNYSVLSNILNNSKKLIKFQYSYLSNKYINNFINDFNDYLFKNNILINNLYQVVIRNNEKNELMVIFVVDEKFNFDIKKLDSIFQNYNIVSIYKSISKNKLLSQENILLKGSQYLKININNLKYYLLPSSFFQINTNMIFKMYNLIKENLSENDIVFDCFSGISSIGQFISDKVKKIYSIEINKDSNKSANLSILKNNIKNIELIEGDFFKLYKNYIKNCNVLILDPPRKGISEEVSNIINNFSNIEKIIYLSCNLKTLSRDLKLLTNYKVLKVYPIKNFPQTSETETLTILVKK